MEATAANTGVQCTRIAIVAIDHIVRADIAGTNIKSALDVVIAIRDHCYYLCARKRVAISRRQRPMNIGDTRRIKQRRIIGEALHIAVQEYWCAREDR